MRMGNFEKKMLYIEVYKCRYWNYEISEYV